MLASKKMFNGLLTFTLLFFLIGTAHCNPYPAEEGDGVNREITVTAIPRRKTSPVPPSPSTTPTPTNATSTSTQAPSTTASTSTTTPPPPSPSPTPAPPPFPGNIGNWSILYPNTTVPCLILQGALQLQIEEAEKIAVPTTILPSGTCGEQQETLELQWNQEISINSNDTTLMNYTLKIQFEINPNSTNEYYISQFEFVRKAPNVTSKYHATGEFFPSSLNHSSQCKSVQSLSSSEGPMTVVTSSLIYEAFKPENSTSPDFSPPEICAADIPLPSGGGKGALIGIIVGVLLSAAIGIGLGIYLGIRYGWKECLTCVCCRRAGDGYQLIVE